MSADRLNQVVGFLAKEESVYGTAVTLVDAEDGCLPYLADGDPEPPTALEYVFDGSIGRAAGNLAPQKRTTPAGRFRQGNFQALFRGAGVTYSAIVPPPNEVHRFLKAAGLNAAFSTDKWVYTPTAAGTTFTSLTVEQYAQGSRWAQSGVICDWSYEATGLGVPIHTFAWRGLASLPADEALPEITYPYAGVIPPVAQAVVENIGAWTGATIRSVRYARNRSVDNPRVAQNLAGGHAGFIPGGASPQLILTVERSARATYDAEAVRDAATSVAVDVTFGSVAFNRWKHAFAQCQLVNVTPQNDGPVATMELTFQAHASTPALNDFETVELF